MNIRFRRMHPDAQIPEYKTAGAVAFDMSIIEDVSIPPRSIAKTRTGLIIEVPDGHVLLLASRSSSAPKKGINMANSIGIIDQDYCGPEDEIHLLLQNITDEPVELKKGDRVCQGLIVPIARAIFEEADEIQKTNRGGFGSTGR